LRLTIKTGALPKVEATAFITTIVTTRAILLMLARWTIEKDSCSSTAC